MFTCVPCVCMYTYNVTKYHIIQYIHIYTHSHIDVDIDMDIDIDISYVRMYSL